MKKHTANQAYKDKMLIGLGDRKHFYSLLNSGEIKAKKEGRIWVIDEAEIKRYNKAKLKEITKHAII